MFDCILHMYHRYQQKLQVNYNRDRNTCLVNFNSLITSLLITRSVSVKSLAMGTW